MESRDECSIIHGKEVFAKGLKKDCCGYHFWIFWGRFKKRNDDDLGEILRPLGGV